MELGKVRFYIPAKGYGFLVPDAGGSDVFVHAKELRRSGIPSLTEGQAVQFESGPGKDGKLKVVAVQLVKP